MGAPEVTCRVIAGGTWSYVPGYCWGHLKLCTGLLLGSSEAMYRVIAGVTWSYVPSYCWGHLKLCTGSELGSPEATYRVIAGVTWSYVSGQSWGHLKLRTGLLLGSPEAMHRVRVGVTWSYVPGYCWGHLKLRTRSELGWPAASWSPINIIRSGKTFFVLKMVATLDTQWRIPNRLLIGTWLYLQGDSEARYVYRLSKTGCGQAVKYFSWDTFPLNSRNKVCLKLNRWLRFRTA